MGKDGSLLRFGVIGCGNMAKHVHCPNLTAIPDTKLVGFCDLVEGKAQQLSDAFGGVYSTQEVERIITDPDIDAVIICIGPDEHPKLVQAAAKAGKHIFVEKPLARTVADAVATMKVVESSGVKFIHGTCNRLAPMVKIAKRVCPKPLYSFSQSSSTVTHMPVHQVDLAINLFHKSPLERIYTSGGQMWNIKDDKDLPADSYSTILTFADGSVFTYFQHGPMHIPLLTKYHFQLFGKEDVVHLSKRYKECHHIKAGKVERSYIFEGGDNDRGPLGYMGHFDELLDLVTCIRNGGVPTMTARQAAYTCAVENAILRSIKIRGEVNFKEFLAEEGALSVIEGL